MRRAWRPLCVALPLVGAGAEGESVLEIKAGLAFEVVGEKGRFHVLAKVISGGGAEIDRAEIARGLHPAAVVPGADDEVDAVRRIVGLIVLFKRGVLGLWAPHVLLIPPAADFERRHGDAGEVRLDSALLPVSVIG